MNNFVVVCWPNSQALMDKPGFRENSYLVNDDKGIEDFGSSAYFVDEEWLESVEETNTPEADAVWEDVRNTCYDAYGELDLRDEKKFTDEVLLSDGRKAIGFYVDDDNDGDPIIEIIIDDGKDVDYENIYALPTEDAGKIAELVDSGDYE